MFKLIDTAAEAVEFCAAKVGVVTHSANNYKVASILQDGTTTYATKRDSEAARQPKRNDIEQSKKRQRVDTKDCAPECVPKPEGISVVVEINGSTAAKRKRKREAHESMQELAFKSYWRENHGNLRPCSQAPAQQRIADLRARVAAKIAAKNGNTGVQ